jgi:CHAT domain-containing protein
LAIAPIRFPDLPTLALSEQEVADFAQIGDSKILLGDSANIVALRQLIGDYEILHFSTHASSGQRENQYPWIALADGRWYLPQIYATPVKASLVVLSACESSEGTYQIGEGPMSLARGFQYAGAPSTIASLWQVNEASTATLMQSFYRYLEAGLPQDQALQRAKLDFLAEAPAIQRSPYYWAAFVQVGQTDSLMEQKFPGWWVLLGILLLGGVGVYYGVVKRRFS